MPTSPFFSTPLPLVPCGSGIPVSLLSIQLPKIISSSSTSQSAVSMLVTSFLLILPKQVSCSYLNVPQWSFFREEGLLIFLVTLHYTILLYRLHNTDQYLKGVSWYFSFIAHFSNSVSTPRPYLSHSLISLPCLEQGPGHSKGSIKTLNIS